MSKHRRLMIPLGTGVVIIAFVFMFKRSAPPGEIASLAISLAGLTNTSNKSRVVECIVSNSNDRAILVLPAKPQVRANGEWPQELTMLPARYSALQPGQTARFTVMAPTNANAEVWRVPLFWVLKPSKKEWVDEVIRQNIAALQSGGGLPGIRIGWGFAEAWTNYSPEVNR